MEFFPSRAVFLSIGNYSIRWYGLLIVTGALVVYFIGARLLKKASYPEGTIDDLFVGCLFFGVIGARIWYVLFSDLSSYLADPISLFKIWNGGLAIQGGVITGILFAYFYAKKHNYELFHLTDMILPNVLLAQAIGRWGNFANQECYGPVVDESYFDGILSFIKDGMYIDGAYRMPMFFYESVLCVVGWILIQLYIKYGRKQRGNGTFGYFAWYGAIRFWIEYYRTDSLTIFGFKTARILAIISLVIGVLGLFGVFNGFINKKKPAIIFDLDGTLIDSEKIIVACFDEVLHKYKPELVLTEEDKISFLGPTLQESFKKYAPEFDTETLVEEYRALNREKHKNGELKAINHVPELLKELSNEGYPIAIASSKKNSVVEMGLKAVGIDQYFDVIIGQDQVENTKPNPECIIKAYKALGYSMSNTIYVGDSGTDIQAAKNAGVYSIAILSNKKRKEELSQENPNKLIEDMAEISEILKEKHPWTYNMM